MKLCFRQLYILQIWMVFLLIIHIVVSFNVFGFLQPISYIVWGCCCLHFLLMFFFYIRETQITYFGLTTLFYCSLLIIFTLLNGTDIKSAIYITIEISLFIMIMSYYRNDLGTLLKTCAITFSLIIYFNLGLMVFFPDWMFSSEDTFDSFLLGGNYNQMGGRMICGIITNVLCLRFNKKWIVNVVFLLIASIVSLILVGSMTALSGIIIFLIFCIIPSLKLKKIGLIVFFTFYVFFQIFVCFNSESLHNNDVAVYIVEDILGKDISFTNRTQLWHSASVKFSESPIIGWGVVDSDWYLTQMDSFAIGPHNFIYSILVTGGITLFIIFIGLCLLCYRRIVPFNNNTSILLLVGIVTFLFMMLMEVYPFFFLIYLLAFVYYFPDLEDMWKQKNIKKDTIKNEEEKLLCYT